jgi:hypothetical protein
MKTVLRSIAVVMVGLMLRASGFAQESFPFYEFSGSTGITSKATRTAPALGAAASIGSGKSAVLLEYTHQSLGNYALGAGTTIPSKYAFPGIANFFPAPQNPITDSTLTEVTGGYSRDMFRLPKSHVAIFLSAEGGIVRNQATDHYVQYCSGCTTPGPPSAVRRRATGAAAAFAGGVRIPIAKGLGLRAGVKFRITSGENAVAYTPSFSGGYSVPGPAISSDRLISVTLGIYYRRLFRQL